jgi:hypothetical protein
MLSSITIQIQALTRRKEKLQNSLHESPQSLLPDPNYTVRFESGCFTRLLTHPSSFLVFFLRENFQHLVTKNKIQCDSYKWFLWKKYAKVARFWVLFFPWNCHIWMIGPKIRLPNYSRILKDFYFPLWPVVAKFGIIPFCGWLNASAATSQNWKKEKKTP